MRDFYARERSNEARSLVNGREASPTALLRSRARASNYLGRWGAIVSALRATFVGPAAGFSLAGLFSPLFFSRAAVSGSGVAGLAFSFLINESFAGRQSALIVRLAAQGKRDWNFTIFVL